MVSTCGQSISQTPQTVINSCLTSHGPQTNRYAQFTSSRTFTIQCRALSTHQNLRPLHKPMASTFVTRVCTPKFRAISRARLRSTTILDAPITLYTAGTPNGWKASIALEELAVPYNVRKINITDNEQKEDWFMKINPNGRIPAIGNSTCDFLR